MFVAFEGIDGSGKGTQAARLKERMIQNKSSCEIIAFPQYTQNAFGQAIGRFLNGDFGEIDQVHPQLAASLYAADRFESRHLIEQCQRDCEVVIFDRYTASNIAHQASKLSEPQAAELTEWITKVERDVFGLPQADLNILLDIPAEIAQQLVLKKKPRDYTEQAADMHESDLDYLRKVRLSYLRLADDSNWKVVSVTKNSELRKIDEIAEEIWEIVGKFGVG